jgi:hypothetical protein
MQWHRLAQWMGVTFAEPLGALHGDESRLPVFDLHGVGRYSVLHATKDGTWCISAETGETEWAARVGRGDIIVGHFLDKKTRAVVVRDGGVLRCYDHSCACRTRRRTHPHQ